MADYRNRGGWNNDDDDDDGRLTRPSGGGVGSSSIAYESGRREPRLELRVAGVQHAAREVVRGVRLLAPQPVGATAGPAGEPDVLRLQRQATPAHEVGELLGIHPDSLHRRPHSRVPPLTSMR